MRRIIILGLSVLVLLLACTTQTKETESPQILNQKANTAYQNQDYSAWLGYMKRLYAISPYSPFTTYNLACAYSLNGFPAKALEALEKSISMGIGVNADRDPDFGSLKELTEFQELMTRAEALNQPVSNSTEAFTVNELDLIPEGITYNPIDGTFFIGSLYKSKIIKVDINGQASDFTAERQDGLRPVTGMKINPDRTELWACSQVSSPGNRNHDPSEMGWSGIFKYDLNTGKLIKKYTLFEEELPHLFNDLVILKNGDVYFTDSTTGSIYRIRKIQDKIELFLRSGEFTYPNGIALSPDQKNLYMAGTLQGVVLVNIQDGTYKPLEHPDGVTTVGIDGLYHYKNSLIAVQNGLGRISRFYLNQAGDKILHSELIEFANPVFNIPTTGTIVGNTFYYLANSQLRSFEADGTIFPPERLANVVVLKTELQ